jgi:hypothetical protein
MSMPSAGELGEALAFVLIAAGSCLAAVHAGLKGWAKKQLAQQLVERKEARAQLRRERHKERRAFRAAVRQVLAEPMADFSTRLERLEHAVDGLMKRGAHSGEPRRHHHHGRRKHS